jgi:hypothetical protein
MGEAATEVSAGVSLVSAAIEAAARSSQSNVVEEQDASVRRATEQQQKYQADLAFVTAHAPELMNGLNYLCGLPGSQFNFTVSDKIPEEGSYYGRQLRSFTGEHEGVRIKLWQDGEFKSSKQIGDYWGNPIEYCVMKNDKIAEVTVKCQDESSSVDVRLVTQEQALIKITEGTLEHGALKGVLALRALEPKQATIA